MKAEIAAALLGVALCQSAGAVDSGDSSPYDRNPSCMEKTTDASQGNCVVQDEGTPRHKYPPRFTEERNRNRNAGSSGTGGASGTGSGAQRNSR